MSLESWSVLFSGLTFLVIAITALAALVQLRHLRASNQLNTLVTILEDWQKPQMQAWVTFVRLELHERLKDPEYLQSIESAGGPLDRTLHPWLHIADYYEQLGSYAKFRLIDTRSYLDVSNVVVADFYERMQPCIEKLRQVRGSRAIFENFEYLAVLGRQWDRKFPEGNFPRGVPRFKELPEEH